MFCFQCQETSKNTGCTIRGVCGKQADIANLQDLLIYLLKGISFWGTRGRNMGVIHDETDLFVAQALFATITNANFDADRFIDLIKHAIEHRDALRDEAQTRCLELHGTACTGSGPDWAAWKPRSYDLEVLLEKARTIGVMADVDLDPDVRSLRQLITYGLKGMAAYTDHAYILGVHDGEVLAFMQEGLEATTNTELSIEQLVDLVLKTGKMGLRAMALLDKVNTETYGNPEPTQVNLGVRPGPGILVSGHDLLDLDELLQQTEGTGVNIYTHGEMLPAHAYPAFKKFPNFVGNYGGSWWRQREEFEAFGGAILMTTNCIVTPKDGYKDRIFTSGMAGFPGVAHIPDRELGKKKDFSFVIAKAIASDTPHQLEEGSMPIGFAHSTILSMADKVIEEINNGAIKRFVVMGGCDGRQKNRNYFTEIVQALRGHDRPNCRMCQISLQQTWVRRNWRDPACIGCWSV